MPVEPLKQESSTDQKSDILRGKKREIDKPLIVISMRNIIAALGMDPNDQHLIGTPERMARMYMELCYGSTKEGKDRANEVFKSVFDSTTREMIVVKNIKSVSLCPHHLLPVEYTSFAGYIANGKVIGISKIPRLFKLLSARPIIQEDLTQEIGKVMMERLQPKGVMVVMKGQHACMRVRGVHEAGEVVTSFVDGIFVDNKLGSREEFLSFVNGSK